MGRTAKPASEAAERERRVLRQYLEASGGSLNALAIRVGVAQPTLQRFYRGETKEVGKRVKPALNYAHNELKRMAPERLDAAKKTPLETLALEACANNTRLAGVLLKLISATVPILRDLIDIRNEEKP